MEETITIQDLQDYYKAKVSPHLTPSMEKMIYFISGIEDFINSPEELERRLSNIANNPYHVDWMIESLNAFEETLAHPPKEKGVLAAIVSFDANQGLDDPTSDEEAIVILNEIIEMMRDALDDKVPPKPKEVRDYISTQPDSA